MKIKCGEIWGGIRGIEIDAMTGGLRASLFSAACDGGKGGDIYYLSVCSEDQLTRIAIADVVGHGQRVSDTSDWLYEAMKEYMDTVDGNQVLVDLNRAAAQRGITAMATATVTGYLKEAGELQFANAGHHPVYVRRQADRNQWKPISLPEHDNLANLPLGIDAGMAYDQSTMPIETGDTVFLYTDGLVEAPNANGDWFGAARLRALLDETKGDAAQIKQAVLAQLNEHTGGNLTHDDVTFMATEIR